MSRISISNFKEKLFWFSLKIKKVGKKEKSYLINLKNIILCTDFYFIFIDLFQEVVSLRQNIISIISLFKFISSSASFPKSTTAYFHFFSSIFFHTLLNISYKWKTKFLENVGAGDVYPIKNVIPHVHLKPHQ